MNPHLHRNQPNHLPRFVSNQRGSFMSHGFTPQNYKHSLFSGRCNSADLGNQNSGVFQTYRGRNRTHPDIHNSDRPQTSPFFGRPQATLVNQVATPHTFVQQNYQQFEGFNLASLNDLGNQYSEMFQYNCNRGRHPPHPGVHNRSQIPPVFGSSNVTFSNQINMPHAFTQQNHQQSLYSEGFNSASSSDIGNQNPEAFQCNRKYSSQALIQSRHQQSQFFRSPNPNGDLVNQISMLQNMSLSHQPPARDYSNGPKNQQRHWNSSERKSINGLEKGQQRSTNNVQQGTRQHNSPQASFSEWENSPRFWRFLKSKKKISHGTMPISVMSYNVLSQSLLEDHQYLYRNCSEENLNWSVRGPSLMQQLEHHKSDILCLQEVQNDHWKSFFQPKLKSSGYEGFFVKRTGDKPDGCAILFQKKKFKLIEFVPVSFLRGGLLDRDNVGSILLLKPRRKYYRGKTHKICIATTHLLFNPRRGDVKLAQLMLFLAEIERYAYLDKGVASQADQTASSSSKSSGTVSGAEMATKHMYCPIILCGDLNLEPKSYLYDFIVKGHLRYDRYKSEQLSGQSEGMGGGYSYVSRKLLPEQLAINDHCQFFRHTAKHLCDNKKSVSEADCSEPSQAVCNKSVLLPADVEKRLTNMNTGQACHNFNFKSVYPHHCRHNSLVTTHHGRASCTVDYIFYSSGKTIQSKNCDRNCVESCKKNRNDSQSGNKKRRRSDSSKSEQQSFSVLSPPKTLRGECEHAASIQNNEKQDFSDSEDANKPGSSNTNTALSKNSPQHRNQYGTAETMIRNSEPEVIVISSDSSHNSTFDQEEESVSDSQIGNMGNKCSNAKTEIHVGLDQNENVQSCVESLELLGYWSLLSGRDLQRIGTLPNKIFPSDHICLIAKFLLH